MTKTPNDDGEAQSLQPGTAHAPTVIGHGKAHTTAPITQGQRHPTTIILPRTKKNAPVNKSVPYITGNLTENEVLTGFIGTWSPVPTSIVYQWLRDGSPIPGNASANATYTLTTADVGHIISLQVTASNSKGSNTVVSAQTAPIHAAAPPNFAPVNITPPTVSGEAKVGSTLTVNAGSWSAFPAATFAYLWYRNGTSTGSVGTTYVLTSADINATIYARVTATNIVAPTQVQSNTVGPVQGLSPAGIFRFGINMSGVQYGQPLLNIFPGSEFPEIILPDAYLDEMKAKKLTDLRIELGWDRIEHVNDRGNLGAESCANLIDLLTRLRARGMTAVIDIHNFGNRYVQSTTTTNLFTDTVFNTYRVDNASGTTVDGLIENSNQYIKRIYRGVTVTTPGQITVTARVKAFGRNFASVLFCNDSLGEGYMVWVDLTSGAISSTVVPTSFASPGLAGTKVVAVGDGSYDITLVANASTARNYLVYVQAHADGVNVEYVGTPGVQPFRLSSLTVSGTAASYHHAHIGDADLPPSALAATWTKIANFLRANNLEDVVSAYDIMNEPNDVGDADVWFTTAQLCINAIRATGSTTAILVEGLPYSGAITFWERNPNLHKLVDPANNWIPSGHCYGDYDNSGAATGLTMTWDVQGGKKVEIPADPINNPNEVVDEMTLVRRCDHMLQGAIARGITRIHIGELGIGLDSIHWNNQMRNFITWAQANKVWFHVWAAGIWGDDYGLLWRAAADGLQSPAMAVVDELFGLPAPTFYRVAVSPRIAKGATTIPVVVTYNGLIPSPITFTPSDNGAGGSFSPTTLTTNMSENWTGTFTYTPASATVNGSISVSNNKGWPTPTAKPFSSYVDLFTETDSQAGVTTGVVLSLYRRMYKAYTGPLIRLYAVTGGAEQDFGRATGSELLDTAAVATWIAAHPGVIKAMVYDQGPRKANLTYPSITDSGPSGSRDDWGVFTLSDSDGYPSLTFATDGGAAGGTRMAFDMGITGKDSLTCLAVFNHTSGDSRVVDWEFFGTDRISLGPTFQSAVDGAQGNYNTYPGEWHQLAFRRERAKFITGFVDGLQDSSHGFSIPALDKALVETYRTDASVGFYRFSTPVHWQGKLREIVAWYGAISDASVAAFAADYATAYAVAPPSVPTLRDPALPTYEIDFRTGVEKNLGSVVASGTYLGGTPTGANATTGITVNSTQNLGLEITGAMKSALFSDEWTMVIGLGDCPGGVVPLLYRDGVQWIGTDVGTTFGNIKGDLTGNGETVDIKFESGTTRPDGVTKSIDVIVITRGKGKLVAWGSVLFGNNICFVKKPANNLGTYSVPTHLRIGDGVMSGGKSMKNLAYIRVWNKSIEDYRQLNDFATEAQTVAPVKGADLPVFYNGVNLSGLEFGFYEQQIPASNFLYYQQAQGANLARIPFTWNRMQPTLLGPLGGVDQYGISSIGKLDQMVADTLAAGGVALLDCHTFGRYGNVAVGTDPVTPAAFADLWGRMAARYGSNPNVHFDLMNEPIAAPSLAVWATFCQAAINAIRVYSNAPIHIEPCNSFGSLGMYSIANSSQFDGDYLRRTLTDTANNLIWHGHQYFDHDGSGQYSDGGGYQRGLEMLKNQTAWARLHGVRLFWGEFGSYWSVATNPAQDICARICLDHISRNRDVWIGFAYFGADQAWGNNYSDPNGGYVYQTWPANYGTPQQTDAPQISYLKLYPGTGYLPPVIPTGVPVITLSTETDASAVAGATLNTYQTDLRISPINANHQVITGKYGPAGAGAGQGESQTIALTTNDRWATATSFLATGTGDPDVAFDKDGNAFWTTIGKGDGTPMGVRRKAVGTTTWTGPIASAPTTFDHPHIVIDPWPTSPYYNRKYFAGRGTCTRSDDGTTWTRTGLPTGTTKFNNGFVFGGVVTKDGTVVLPYKSAQDVVLNGAGGYAGLTSDFYVLRSTDGGVSFTSVPVYTTLPVASNGSGAYYGCSNLGYTPPTQAIPNGRLHLVVNQFVSGAPTVLKYFQSDDLGVTWSGAGPTLGTVTNWGADGACFNVNASGMLVMSWMAQNGNALRMYAIASRDSGATWCDPVKINSTDFNQPSQASQNRTPTQDQMYSGVALSDGSFEICWTQNVGSDTYHAYRRKITVA